MKRKESDESVVLSTQTELGFFLVIVFVMLVGFMVSVDQKKAGTGVKQQGEPHEWKVKVEGQETLPPQSVEPRPDNAVITGSIAENSATSTWKESASRAIRKVTSCRVEYSAERAAIILPTDQTVDGGSRKLTFPIGQDRIPDEVWDNCIGELFQAVISTYLEQRASTRHILIQGHTSSEWNVGAGCPGVTAASDPSRNVNVAYKCNRQLSINRAEQIFEAGYFFNRLWSENGADTALPPDEFARVFFTEGRSFLDVIRDGSGTEDSGASRRVEFVFIAKQ